MSNQPLKPGWKVVRFGDVVHKIQDRVTDLENCGLTEYTRGEHFEPGSLRLIGRSKLGDGLHGSAFHMRFKKGDVLYVSRNPHLRKVAIADYDGICANTSYVCRADNQNLLHELLPFIMQTEDFVEYTIRHKRGSTNFYLNWSDIAPYEFPLPPLDEQRRIIKVLDAVRKVLDEANQAFISAKALSRVALNNIVIGFAADSLDEYRLVTDIPLPENWQFLKAQDLCTVKVTSGSTPRTGIVDDDTGMPFLRVQNLEFDCSLDFNSNPKFLNDGVFKGTEAQHVIPGDVLTNIVGPPLGKVSIVPNEFPESQINQAIVRFRPKDNYLRSIISGYLMSDWAKRWLFSRSKKTSGQRNINSSTCAILPIPTPPKSEQEKIAKLIENVKLTGDKTEKRLEQSQTMMKQMLSKFLGGN